LVYMRQWRTRGPLLRRYGSCAPHKQLDCPERPERGVHLSPLRWGVGGRLAARGEVTTRLLDADGLPILRAPVHRDSLQKARHGVCDKAQAKGQPLRLSNPRINDWSN
jgi:hypothetical protein